MVNEVQRKCKGCWGDYSLNNPTNPFVLFKILLSLSLKDRDLTSQNCMYVFVRVHVRTLGLGAHFGLATPPAVHLPATRTLSPGVKMAWTTKKRERRFKSAWLLPAPKQEEKSEKMTDEELDEGGRETPPTWKHWEGKHVNRIICLHFWSQMTKLYFTLRAHHNIPQTTGNQ